MMLFMYRQRNMREFQCLGDNRERILTADTRSGSMFIFYAA